MAVHMGYIGVAAIQSSHFNNTKPIPVFLTGSSLNPVQNINAPDLVQGQFVKHAWNFDKIEIGGNITGPIDENHSSVFDAAWVRKVPTGFTEDPFTSTAVAPGSELSPDHLVVEDMTIYIAYYRSGTAKDLRVFGNCAINSYELTVTAGDVASFTIDFYSAGTTAFAGEPTDALNTQELPSTGDQLTAPCAKLVTWDRCAFKIEDSAGDNIPIGVQAFTFTVNNNLQRVYKIRSNEVAAMTLYPVELVAGFRDVTGNVTVYAGDRTDAGSTPGAPEEQFKPATVNDPNATSPPNERVFGADSWGSYAPDNMKLTTTVDVGTGLSGLDDGSIHIAFEAVYRRPEATAKTDLQTYTLNFQGLCTLEGALLGGV
jgi:hypothetical protein